MTMPGRIATTSFAHSTTTSRSIVSSWSSLPATRLAPGDPNVEIGLAFLVCGPVDIVGNKDAVQAAQIRADAVDEMIRATGETFLGLTIGCARCHDHKFDPSHADATITACTPRSPVCFTTTASWRPNRRSVNVPKRIAIAAITKELTEGSGNSLAIEKDARAMPERRDELVAKLRQQIARCRPGARQALLAAVPRLRKRRRKG